LLAAIFFDTVARDDIFEHCGGDDLWIVRCSFCMRLNVEFGNLLPLLERMAITSMAVQPPG
jgi:hypothetical protein